MKTDSFRKLKFSPYIRWNRSSLSSYSDEMSNHDSARSYCNLSSTVSDKSKIENPGIVTNRSMSDSRGTSRDAFESENIDDYCAACNSHFLNDSSYLDPFMLGVGNFMSLDLRIMESDFTLPPLKEATNDPLNQVRGLPGDFWMNLDKHKAMGFEKTDTDGLISFFRNYHDLSYSIYHNLSYMVEVDPLPALLPPKFNRKRVTLVLDLDETLVHSTTRPCSDADFSLRIPVNKEETIMYVRRRPFLRAFLESVSERFEIILFTAGKDTYAKLMLDHLDPEGKFFSRCASRGSCILADGILTKDLTVLGIDLAKVAIVDNTPSVYRWQVNNGIPIKSWFVDPRDTELMSLLPFLETLANVDDVRPIIEQKFGVKGQ